MAVSANDEPTTVEITEDGAQGLPGDNGIDGAGFNQVRMQKLNNPLCHLFKTNNATETLSGALTWTRATTKKIVNRYGKVVEVAIDTPSEEAEGWLIEGASTNLLAYSEQLDDVGWLKTRCTITANDDVAPDGNNTADLLVSTDTGSYVSQSQSGVSGVTLTIAAYFKYTNHDTGYIRVGGATNRFNIQTGAPISISTGYTYNYRAIGGGWGRFTITYTPTATGTIGMQIGITDNTSGDTCLLWGAQMEELPFASSYIVVNSGTPVTRAADVVSCQGLNNTANLGGAMSVSYKVKSLGNTGNFGFIYAIGAIGASDYLSFSTAFRNNGEDKLTLYSGGAPNNNVFVGGDIYSDSNIFSETYDGTNRVIYQNGVLLTSTSMVYLDSNIPNKIDIGGRTGVSNPMYGHIKNFQIFDEVLNQDEVTYLSGQ